MNGLTVIGWRRLSGGLSKKMAWKLATYAKSPPKSPTKFGLFIQRDWDRTESDDWQLNVQPRLNNSTESLEIRDENGELFGWRIQSRGE